MTRFGKSTITKLGLIPLFAMMAVGFLWILTGNSWLKFIACSAAGLLAAAFVIRPSLDDLAVTVQVPARVVAGSEVTSVVRIENTGASWSPLCHFKHLVEGFVAEELRIDPLPPGAVVVVESRHECEKRGVVTNSTAALVTTEPFGMFLRKRVFGVPLHVIAHPQEVPVQVPAPRGGSTDDREWIVSRSGLDIHGVREWRPGDESNRIHWRTTARRGRLVVLEREIPKAGGLAILLCAAPADETWESVVSVAGWTASATSRTGRDVALVAHHVGVQMVSGEPVDLLDWCAALSAGAYAGDAELARACEFVGAGGDVLVASGAQVPSEWWEWAVQTAHRRGVVLERLQLPAATDD